MARVDEVPLQIVVDERFSFSERAAVMAAIDEWNVYGKEVRGAGYFLPVGAEVPAQIREANPKNCGETFGHERKFYFLKEGSSEHWKTLGFDDSIPGATLRCVAGDSVIQQVIIIKPNLVLESQITSVAIHELGHSIGLDHSCTSSTGRPDFVACGKVDASHPYHSAVMYPTIRTRRPENGLSSAREVDIKNNLGANDKARASCLYPQ